MMKKVFASQDQRLIDHYKNILEINGINPVIRNFYVGKDFEEFMPSACLPELWVLDDEKYIKAKLLIAESPPIPRPGKPWRCIVCGEYIEEYFNQCWKCASSRPIT